MTYCRSQLVTNIEAVLYYKYRVFVWLLFFYCSSREHSSLYPEIRRLSLGDVCMYVCTGGCPESIRPFWISREPVAWPWRNLAASQRRLYCASVNSHTPVGLVSRQWDAVDWACVLCDRRLHIDRASRSASSRQCTCAFYSSRAGLFFLAKRHITQVCQHSYSPGLALSCLLAFTKAKIAVENEENCECDGHTVQQGQSTASHCRLTSPTGECSRMHSKVSSDWLPSYVKSTRPVLEIFKMAGYFPDSPRMYVPDVRPTCCSVVALAP